MEHLKRAIFITVFAAILISPLASGQQELLASLGSNSFSATGNLTLESVEDHVRWKGTVFDDFRLEAETARVTAKTTTYQSMDPVIAFEPDESEESTHYDEKSQFTIRRSTHESVLLVVPTLGHRTTLSQEGSLDGDYIDEELLEWDHSLPESSDHHRYQYKVENEVGVNFNDQNRALVTGDFMLHVWEADLNHQHSQGRSTHESGYTENDADRAGIVKENRWTHLEITVTNATLYAETSESRGSVSLFSSSTLADIDGYVTYHRATGSVATLSGLFNVPGKDAIVKGGVVRWEPRAQTIQTGFLQPAESVSGADIERQPEPGAAFSLPLVPLLLAISALIVVGAVYAAPNMHARKEHDEGTWRQKRAKGFHKFADQAKQHEKNRLALSLAKLAFANNRRDPETGTLLASLQSERGSDEEAFRIRRIVHHVLMDDPLPEPRIVANNAYESARIAGRLTRDGQALHWLKIAISYEPELAHEARWDVDFDRISQNPEFKMIVGERVDVGWNPTTT